MAKGKIKKLSYRALQRRVVEVEGQASGQFKINALLRAEVADLKKKLTERLDFAMLQERIRLANALGQMIHTVTDAVKFVIGKEVL